MRNRTLFLAILTASAGTGATGYFLLLPVLTTGEAAAAAAAATTSGTKIQQSRAFTVAACATATAVTNKTNTTAAITFPDKPFTPPGPRDEARVVFLQRAERTGDTAPRLAMLGELHVLMEWGCLSKPTAGDWRRLKQARGEWQTAVCDLTTLTPEARREWDQQEAAGWPDALPAAESVPVLMTSAGTDNILTMAQVFDSDRNQLTLPLLEDYERLDRRHEQMEEHLSRPGPSRLGLGPPDLIEAARQRDAAYATMRTFMLETELQRRTWEAKNWEGYKSPAPPPPAPPDSADPAENTPP